MPRCSTVTRLIKSGVALVLEPGLQGIPFPRLCTITMTVEYETTDVLICGCGPTGAMLSGYLGKANVANIVLEREDDITTDPRGIVLDDDGIRLLQGLGLYDQVFNGIGLCEFQLRYSRSSHRLNRDNV